MVVIMKQSIIITYHKNKDMLMFCLKRILKTVPEDIEIFIIGNNVNKNELDIEISDPRCRYFKVNKNLQYPKALNLSVEMCSGEIITFVDADIFVWDGWYNALLKTFLSSDIIGVAGAKLVNPLSNRILDFGIMYSKFNAAHTMMGLLYNHPLAMTDRKVQTVCSAIMMTSKELYKKIGGMDEDIPYSYTDCDYCFRLRDIGYETWVSAGAVAYHKGDTDSNNSKSGFSYYRLDAKGMYGMKDYGKIVYDSALWYKISADYFLKTYSLYVHQFLMLDFTTLYDRESFYQVIENCMGIQFLDIVEHPNTIRDNTHIVLYNEFSFEFIDLVTPILYFVDTFVSLFDNELWFHMRDIQYDIVIDRHGNIVPLELIAQRKC